MKDSSRRVFLCILAGVAGGYSLAEMTRSGPPLQADVKQAQLRAAAAAESNAFVSQVSTAAAADNLPADDGKLRIICFGAHPDDAEYKSGGTAAKWAQQGHHVKLVSVTNGDIGHWQMAGGPLAQRRTAESKEVARRLGCTAEVLDIHDGELLPTLENRQKIVRLIREWRADIVIAHRPWDYHPDHRYVGILVQDAAFMVTVPFFCPDVPPLKRNPVFLYSSDGFQKPYPFEADIAVSVDDVFEQKVTALTALESQTFEGGANGSQEYVDNVPPASAPDLRREWLKERWQRRQAGEANRFRDSLIGWYGEERGKAVQYAEAFEVCEYGRQPSRAELKELFPFFE
jgi:LmbE family N-acetylglucosaminyl deacetylase